MHDFHCLAQIPVILPTSSLKEVNQRMVIHSHTQANVTELY